MSTSSALSVGVQSNPYMSCLQERESFSGQWPSHERGILCAIMHLHMQFLMCACWSRQFKGLDDKALATKHALWRELAEAGFARTASAIWLLPLLHLLLRVQLNILGRQLFVESNLVEPR